jgi:hypothetical protein
MQTAKKFLRKQGNILEDACLHSHRLENLKSYEYFMLSVSYINSIIFIRLTEPTKHACIIVMLFICAERSICWCLGTRMQAKLGKLK